MTAPEPRSPTDEVAARYARRGGLERYSPLQPDVNLTLQERQRALLALLRQHGWHSLADKRVTEVGCGAGGNLLEMLRLGCSAQHLQGLELLSERLQMARAVLPAATALWLGDARAAPVAPASQDLVLQSTVFSSLPDEGFQQELAQAMWRWLRPGGAVLWYDMRVNNPRNPDVRGLPLRRVRELFPQARLTARRITLAPPLARALCRVHPGLYAWANAVPWLRTHALVWLGKD